MKGKNMGVPAVVTIILIISLVLNLFLGFRYVDQAKRQNTMWSNAISHLAKVINWTSINSGDLTDDKNEWQYPLNQSRTNLRLLQVQLDSIQILPYAQEIFPWKQREKLRLFINYNFEVVSLLEQELEGEGEISRESRERVQIIHNTWEEILRVLETERNKQNPFKPVFTSATWSQVFAKAVEVFDSVELVPLPEKKRNTQ